MEVLFCFDENYEQHFGAAVTSLILNNLPHLQTVHIITNKVSNKFNQKIAQLKAKTNVNFLVYEIDDEEVKNLQVSYHISAASYYRLLAPKVLPNNINKILYLDSDLIVNGSIVELYNSDISNYLVAAYSGNQKAVATKKRLELKSDYYFNAGVILINLEAWRNLNIGNRCIEFMRDYPHLVPLLDQDALNKIIDGEFLNLDKKWNSLVDLYARQSQADEHSIIFHFIGSLKPWHSWCISAEKQIYWSYLKQSPWSNYGPEIPNKPKKILSAVKAILKQMQNSKNLK